MYMVTTTVAVHLKNIWSYKQRTIQMEGAEEIVSRLKFIGCVEKNEKIDTRNVNRQPNNLLTKIFRSIIYPDNRENSLKFIREVVDRSFEIIDRYLHNNEKIPCQILVSDLSKAKQGLNNLKFTYSTDTKFCCDIDVLAQGIESKLTKIKEQNPEIFDKSGDKILPQV